MRNKKELNDTQLMNLYKASDIEAFNLLFERWKGRVMSYICKHIQSPNERDDLLQNIFFKLHNSRNSFNDNFIFDAWIYTISRTTVIDHLRKNKNYQYSHLDEHLVETTQDNNTASEIEIFDGLEDQEKQLLELRYIEGHDFNTISRLTNKSSANARKSVSRIIHRLRERLGA